MGSFLEGGGKIMGKEKVEINSIPESANQPTLFDKLIGIMEDPELAVEIGLLLRDLKFPGMIQRGLITEAQKEQLMNTWDETAKSLLTPEQWEEAEREGTARVGEVSEFIHMR